jgi:predicted O-methyltransferase YrrM
MADAQRPSWKMGGITNPAVEDYLYNLIPARDEVLAEMERIAAERRIPIVGPLVGRLLFQLAQVSGVKAVFEMGSAIGYSTVWWARAVGEGGRVVYTDGDRLNADEARRFLERAGVLNRVEIRVGDAIELLSEQKTEFDVIFNDIDKEDYPRAFRVAVPKLRKGGLLISDNTLWHGDVADPGMADDPETRGILEFNRLMFSAADLYTTLLPLRDGITVARKL